jgi:hypothetical protein
MITTLKSIVSCEILGLGDSFQGNIFGHAFFKSCQCATTYEKLTQTWICVKSLQGDLQKCIN